jgi:CubicO group peptidase (beta-lactamase class C family)
MLDAAKAHGRTLRGIGNLLFYEPLRRLRTGHGPLLWRAGEAVHVLRMVLTAYASHEAGGIGVSPADRGWSCSGGIVGHAGFRGLRSTTTDGARDGRMSLRNRYCGRIIRRRHLPRIDGTALGHRAGTSRWDVAGNANSDHLLAIWGEP